MKPRLNTPPALAVLASVSRVSSRSGIFLSRSGSLFLFFFKRPCFKRAKVAVERIKEPSHFTFLGQEGRVSYTFNLEQTKVLDFLLTSSVLIPFCSKFFCFPTKGEGLIFCFLCNARKKK